MIYEELVRVGDLDKQIADLHQALTQLYSERSNILQKNIGPIGGDEKTDPNDAALIIYNKLLATWKELNVTIPSYSMLRKKIIKAVQLQTELVNLNDALRDKVYVVAVPPFKTLDSAMKAISKKGTPRFQFADENIRKNMSKTKVWSFVLVFDAAFDQKVENVMDQDDYFYEQYDCRAFGVQELVAAELQGIKSTPASHWVLLLKDGQNDKFIPSATFQNGNIILDIDDANGLLGSNYIRPAIKAA